jgi:hypothetical protein
MGWFTFSGFAATHPLGPLSTNELRAAVEVLLKENKIASTNLPRVRLEYILHFIPMPALPEGPAPQFMTALFVSITPLSWAYCR